MSALQTPFLTGQRLKEKLPHSSLFLGFIKPNKYVPKQEGQKRSFDHKKLSPFSKEGTRNPSDLLVFNGKYDIFFYGYDYL
ncbi:hypothetical protein [Cytobacillus kochii]